MFILILQTMSHINDLINVVKGFRQIVEAGVKLQQDNAKLIWNNSSIRPLLQTCQSNPLTNFKANPEAAKDLIDRAFVVAQGLRQYAVMHVPNFNSDTKKPDMDSKLQEELEQLNKEFDKTFESLKKTQKNITSREYPPLPENVEVPLGRLQMQADRLKVKAETQVQHIEDSISSSKIQNAENTQGSSLESKPTPKDPVHISSQSSPGVPKPVAKKKIRVSVCICFIVLLLLPYEDKNLKNAL